AVPALIDAAWPIALTVLLPQCERRRHDPNHAENDQNPSHENALPLSLSLVVISLFAGWYRDAQPVLSWRKWARCIGSERARRINQPIEIQPKLTRLRKAVVGELRIQKPPGAIRLSFAGAIAQDEKKIFRFRVFEHRFEPRDLAIDRKFGHAGRRKLADRPQDCRNF